MQVVKLFFFYIKRRRIFENILCTFCENLFWPSRTICDSISDVVLKSTNKIFKPVAIYILKAISFKSVNHFLLPPRSFEKSIIEKGDIMDEKIKNKIKLTN